MAISQASPETTYPQPNAQPTTKTRLLDLDAAGADFTQPAPAGLVEFLHDESLKGTISLWSAKLAEPDGPTTVWRWITDAEAAWRDKAFAMQLAPVEKPAGEGVEALSPPKPAAASTTERSTTRTSSTTTTKE